MAITKQNN